MNKAGKQDDERDDDENGSEIPHGRRRVVLGRRTESNLSTANSGEREKGATLARELYVTPNVTPKAYVPRVWYIQNRGLYSVCTLHSGHCVTVRYSMISWNIVLQLSQPTTANPSPSLSLRCADNASSRLVIRHSIVRPFCCCSVAVCLFY
jgi:hypothetical protein